MTVFIDPPMWAAHGTVWSHLITDANRQELHDFASGVPLPRRSFDLDHYDVPEHLYDRAVSLGAKPVPTRDLVRILQDSGLRIRPRHRTTETPVLRHEYLASEWSQLGTWLGTGRTEDWDALGQSLLARWTEAHRVYHDDRHLEDVLLALNHLGTLGETVGATALLSAWFHDAVYRGVPGTDERESAELAERALSSFSLGGQLLESVRAVILATQPGAKSADTLEGALLLDADLAILGASRQRYLRYTEQVRAEYGHVPTDQFRRARTEILTAFLTRDAIYRTKSARSLWENRARANIADEIQLMNSRLT